MPVPTSVMNRAVPATNANTIWVMVVLSDCPNIVWLVSSILFGLLHAING
jgi:hypothetical protein